MRTAEEMVKFCENKRYASSSKIAIIHFSVAEKLILPDEEVFLAFVPIKVEHSGFYDLTGSAAVMFTNKRCIYAQKRKNANDYIKSIQYAYINDVYVESEYINAKIALDELEEKIIFEVDCRIADELVEQIKDIIQEYRTEYIENSNNDIPDIIKKYKELLDIGAITQDEYNFKKRQLLKM